MVDTANLWHKLAVQLLKLSPLDELGLGIDERDCKVGVYKSSEMYEINSHCKANGLRYLLLSIIDK